MGSSQSLNNIQSRNSDKHQTGSFEVNQLAPLSISKSKLPPIQQNHRPTVRLTDENVFQINQSVSSSENSFKNTPQKSQAYNCNDSGGQMFNWPNDNTSNGCNQATLSHELGSVKTFSYDNTDQKQSEPPCLKSRFQSNSVTLEKKKYTLDQEKLKEHLQIFKLDYQNIQKKKVLVKLAFVGARTAVGKSTLIKSFVQQSIDFDTFDIKQTIGCDISFSIYELDDTQINLQLWEFESNEQSVANWKNQLNQTFDTIIFVFDEFGQKCAEAIKTRLQLIQQICNSSNSIIPIMMAGNDRLNMTITGKEMDIRNSVKKLHQGDQILVKIIDPKQLKETNSLFKTIIQGILDLQN